MNELSYGWHWQKGGSRWNEYLQQRDVVDAINSGTSAAAEHIAECMAVQTAVMLEGMERQSEVMLEGFLATTSLLSTIGSRIVETNRRLTRLSENISEGFDQLDASFNWGFNAMLGEMGGMQATLQDLLKVAKTPAQTAAFEHFEMARENYRRKLEPEAILELDKAINGVSGVSAGNPTEWRFHFHRGTIMLGSYSTADFGVVNPVEAEKSFSLAGRYARSDAPEDAARAFLAAGWAAYVTSEGDSERIQKALRHSQEAVRLNPDLDEAVFQVAKLQMALAQTDDAIKTFEPLIWRDDGYLLRAATDGDFKKHEPVLNSFLQEFHARISEQLCGKTARLTPDNISFLKTLERRNDASPKAKAAALRLLCATAAAHLIETLHAHESFQGDLSILENETLDEIVHVECEQREQITEEIPTGETETHYETYFVTTEVPLEVEKKSRWLFGWLKSPDTERQTKKVETQEKRPVTRNVMRKVTRDVSCKVMREAVITRNALGRILHQDYKANLVAWGLRTEIPKCGNFVAVAAGAAHSLGLKKDGTVVGWGDNVFGQAIPPADLRDVIAVAAGGFHSLALKKDGTVVGWGKNNKNQAKPPEDLQDVVSIAAGGSFSLALKRNGTVVAWAASDERIPPMQGVRAIAVGSSHSLALKKDRTVVAWGSNSEGQAKPPIQLRDVVAISAGSSHSLALKKDGTVAGWGRNAERQAAAPTGLRDVVAIAAGGFYSLALKRDGTVVGWGENDKHQATPPEKLRWAVAIAAGGLHSLAVVGMEKGRPLA